MAGDLELQPKRNGKSFFPAANQFFGNISPYLFDTAPTGQKVIHNPDRTMSTERTMTTGIGNRFYNIPTIQQNLGVQLSHPQAITAFKIGQNPAFGSYPTLGQALWAEKNRHKLLFESGGY